MNKKAILTTITLAACCCTTFSRGGTKNHSMSTQRGQDRNHNAAARAVVADAAAWDPAINKSIRRCGETGAGMQL